MSQENLLAGSHLDDLARDGFAVLRGVFSPWEIDILAQAFDRHYAEGLRLGRSFRHGNLHYRVGQDPERGPLVRMVQWPTYGDEDLGRVRIDNRLYELLSPLLGEDIKQIINQLHWKPAGAATATFGWHQDIRFRRPRHAYRNPENSYLQTAIAIDPQGAEEGGMTFIPGSHASGEIAFDASTPVLGAKADLKSLDSLGLDAKHAVTPRLEPGDLMIWSLFTVHGSGRNRGSGERRLYLNGYVRAEDCDRGEWAFRGGRPCQLGAPMLVHYEDLERRPEPHFTD